MASADAFVEQHATSKADDEDILKCPICLDVYTNPKYLPCLHTYCETCLQSFILSSLKEIDTKSKVKVEFNCPVCRVAVPVSIEACKLEECASSFPKNCLIDSLIDKHKLKSNVKSCDPCLIENENVAAVSWCKSCNEAMCEVCAKHHRKLAGTRQHKLFNLSETEVSDMTVLRYEYCDIHKDRILEALCVDHDHVCCMSCATFDHRKCGRVVPLSDAATGVRDQPETQKLLKWLQGTETCMKQLLGDGKQNADDLNTQKENMLEEITVFRRQIIDHLNNLETKLREDVEGFQKRYATEINDRVFDLENKYQTIVTYKKLLETCLRHADDIQVFLQIKRLAKKTKGIMSELSAALLGMERIGSKLYFTEELETHVLSLRQLGEVKIERIRLSSDAGLNQILLFWGLELTKYSSFSLPKCAQSAMFLPSGNLVIAMERSALFCNAKSEMRCNLTGSEITSASELKGFVTYSDSEILMSRPSNHEIYMVDVKSAKISKTWKSNYICYNLTKLGDAIVAACVSRLDFMDSDGTMSKSIKVQGEVLNITSHENTMYYTNRISNTVYAMKLDGQNKFEYNHPELRGPRGIATDHEGFIYVAGYDSSNVHQISPIGTLVQIVLTKKDDDIEYPDVLCFDQINKKLLVSHSDKIVSVYSCT